MGSFNASRPIIGITTGDPAGIGLEVVLKSVSEFIALARCVLFTDTIHFNRCCAMLGATGLATRWISDLSELSDDPVLFLINVPTATEGVPWGDTSPRAGSRAVAYLEAASAAALAGRLQAIVTAPVTKASIGPEFKGQTEFLAERAQAHPFAMGFFAPTFKVVLATVHMSLRQALDALSTEKYVELIPFVNRELMRFGYSHPRIAIAAVNPHAGEGGMFGTEEIEILEPAVKICRAMEIRVSGPHSADSLYFRAHSGEFDVIIAPYHDQGLAPVKLIAHGESTNVTLGLPYVRTSPDHGTALNIAGRNMADAGGMKSALRCALDLLDRQLRQSRQTP